MCTVWCVEGVGSSQTLLADSDAHPQFLTRVRDGFTISIIIIILNKYITYLHIHRQTDR